MSPSYIVIPDTSPHPLWPLFEPSSFIVRVPPPRRKRARRRPTAWRTRADAYAALLTGDEYAEAARDALRAGDDAAALGALEVLRSIAEVLIAKLRGSSSENLGALQ
jgi:hypothetical protein